MSVDSVSSPPVPETLCTWSVPGLSAGTSQVIDARAGEVTCIVGANGAGKSALGMWLNNNSGATRTRRLIAHRRLWFQEAGPDISPAQRVTMATNMESWSRDTTSRYLDHADRQRASIVLFDILATLNAENGRIADVVMSGADPQMVDQMRAPRILDRLNAILGGAGLPVQLVLTERQTFNVMNSLRGVEYPIFQMSDGEKSAVLLASEVLTAESGSIQIIDEPERHLHRSISAGLVEAIVAARPDCHFVVLTHDLELASSLGKSNEQTFVLTQCAWSGEQAIGWELFAVDTPYSLPENARAAILGGRRDILFIEGQSDSLDRKLYELLFPGWELSPSGGSEQVVRSVTGLQSSESHHWIRARGVVDGDGRTAEEREALTSRGVLPLPVSEVESLYYLDVVVRAIASAQAAALEKAASELAADARARSLAALRVDGTFARLAGKLSLAEVRRKIVEQLPTQLGPNVNPIEFSFPSPYASVLAKIEALSAEDDLDGLVRLLPIRDTPMRSQVASALGYRNIADYESAVRVRIKNDEALAGTLRDIVGPLPVRA